MSPAEKDPLHLHALRNRFLRTPNVVVQRIDPEAPEDLAGLENCFDTVLCLNVLEYLDDPAAVLRSLRATLKPGGVLVVLVPNGPRLFGSLDRSLGHKRRFNSGAVRQLLEDQGFSVEKAYQFNKAGAPPWWAYSKMLGLRENQQAGAEDFRQDRVDLAPARPPDAVARPLADRGGPQARRGGARPNGSPQLSLRHAD